MKEIEIFIVRFKKKKGVFTTAQVNRLVKGICSAQQGEPDNNTNQQAARRAGSRKKKVKVALQY